jgi:type I restriction enzyme, S subunit
VSFPRYPSYRPSGVEWLGSVPSHWSISRLKRACDAFPSNVDKKSVTGETDVRLCNYTDVYYNDRIVASMDLMAATATADQIKRFTLRAGDTVITKDSETADDIAVGAFVPDDLPGVVCGYHLSIVRPRADTHGAFIKWFFDSAYARAAFEVRANGLTRVGLGQYELDNVDLALPAFEEQVAIAAFLDRETAKIDGLVAEQERLIELLKEKRQAVISHAVTKGLNPDAPMKPSGVEWLGDIPASWGVIHSRRLFRARNEPARPTDEQLTASQKYGMLPQAEFMEREGRGVVQIITGTDSLRHVEPDDFVISLRSFQGGLEWCRLAGAITFHYVALVPQKHVVPDFFAFLFKCAVYIQALRATANLIRDGQDLRYSHFVQVPLPVVPLADQKAIAEFLVAETQCFDAASETAQQAIDVLLERRAALVSAAVTGQIDVRGVTSTAA